MKQINYQNEYNLFKNGRNLQCNLKLYDNNICTSTYFYIIISFEIHFTFSLFINNILLYIKNHFIRAHLISFHYIIIY